AVDDVPPLLHGPDQSRMRQFLQMKRERRRGNAEPLGNDARRHAARPGFDEETEESEAGLLSEGGEFGHGASMRATFHSSNNIETMTEVKPRVQTSQPRARRWRLLAAWAFTGCLPAIATSAASRFSSASCRLMSSAACSSREAIALIRRRQFAYDCARRSREARPSRV